MKLLVLVLLSLPAPSSATGTAAKMLQVQAMIFREALRKALEIDRQDLISWRLYDVVYDTNKANVIRHPPEAMHRSSVANNQCQKVVKKVTLTKAIQVDQRWDTGDSTTRTVGGSITATLPFISTGVSFSTATTKSLTKGSTLSETITQSVTVEMNVPPNHMCSATMMVYKYGLKIPFTAVEESVTRNGQYRDNISGMYDSVLVGEVRALVDRCEPIPNATPCP